jgi:hypothetical protein
LARHTRLALPGCSKLSRRRDVPIERRACDAQLLTQRCDIGLRLAHSSPCKAQLSWCHLGPAASLASTGTSGRKSCLSALRD